jgi:hypothetical protein
MTLGSPLKFLTSGQRPEPEEDHLTPDTNHLTMAQIG